MRYLIIKTSAFGDIVHAYGVLEYLKQVDPTCEIDWVVEKRMEDLVKNHPYVSRTITVDTKKWRKNFSRQELSQSIKDLRKERYDALFDLQGNIKSAIITLLARAKSKIGLGFKSAPESISALSYTHRYNPPPLQNVRDDYLFLVTSFFGQKPVSTSSPLLKIDSYTSLKGWLICPGSNWKNKQLTFDTLVAFLERCEKAYHPHFVFLAGSDAEKVQAEELVKRFQGSEILFRPSLPQLQHSMNGSELVISMDSLPLHLAATTRVPTFSFFGPSSSHKYNPPGHSHGSFQGPCPYGVTFEKRCPRLRTCPTGACLREADPEVLFKSFQQWFISGLSSVS
ncbi:MAG: glycosyltransferase family 9 protein [Verrucomicrobia bacterium]|nr:glycosyltransferase family 9 protein [Verrucomicrobiota bacterium]